MPLAQTYRLIAVLGLSPSVLTETLYYFARLHTPRRIPEDVHVITTRLGQAAIQTKLLTPSETMPSPWDTFCTSVLHAHPRLTIEVPHDDDQHPLEDIRHRRDDEILANACYQRVATYAMQEDTLPLIGSIAGGRKTMSAYLLAAFSIFARPQDRLVHVLVRPAQLERDRAFLYPTAMYPEATLDLIDIPFPRLYHALPRDVLRKLPTDNRTLSTLLTALEPYVTTAPVAHVEVHLFHERYHKSTCTLYDATGQQRAQVKLSPAPIMTLLLLAECIARGGGKAYLVDLPTPAVEPLWQALLRDQKPSFWETTKAVSQARSRLRDALETVPYAWRLVPASSQDTHHPQYTHYEQFYTWEQGPPTFTVHATIPPERWPFMHIRLAPPD